ncbi:transcriptional regulator, TetR family [Devosia enhydra]|uniref:Transcriptional regulator, TetR family n=1 Tax=Devosia enhydra TaxID=665118 RepID=A0A1K2HSW6_9HYPH|nr:TetR/AcrR family transcriptional regulator [Devosia enhydra]SFZ81007.1 transcriptional regulator, TetR family [Devosia enhydra]
MPRPRSISDEALLDAALGLMARTGPEGLSFAALSSASGLAPATLVQRFGSRDRLMEAALLRAWDRLDAETAAADADCPVTPQGAVALLVRLSGAPDGPDTHGEGLLLLREDFRRPVLRARGAAWGTALATALGRRIAPGNPKSVALGRLMASQWQGAVIWWGFSRTGTLAETVSAELSAWLRLTARA